MARKKLRGTGQLEFMERTFIGAVMLPLVDTFRHKDTGILLHRELYTPLPGHCRYQWHCETWSIERGCDGTLRSLLQRLTGKRGQT